MLFFIISLVVVGVIFGGRKAWAKLTRIYCLITYTPTQSQVRACEIMGKNFFGIEEAIGYFGILPTREQIKALAEIPFTEKTLEECRDTHILVAILPISIFCIYRKNRKLFFRNLDVYFSEYYRNQAFANYRGETAWQLIRKTMVSNSTNKTWDEQQVLLDSNEETPKAQVMVYAFIGHYLANSGKSPLIGHCIYVRCLDTDSCNGRVYVGFGSSLDVYGDHDRIRSNSLGLASAVKVDKKP